MEGQKLKDSSPQNFAHGPNKAMGGKSGYEDTIFNIILCSYLDLSRIGCIYIG